MNFSTVPPYRWISSRAISKKRAICARRRSGSTLAASAVEATTSAKRTVTSFRSSPAGVAARGPPQFPQKFMPVGLSKPQTEQRTVRALFLDLKGEVGDAGGPHQ